MMRAAEYIANSRYASEIRTEGVMVMTAAIKKLKAVWIVDGKVDMACMRVEYEAMIIGGKGGKLGSGGGMLAAVDPDEGW